MAKKSSVARNEKRRRMAEQYTQKREALKTVLKDSSSTVEERIEARSELSKLPRNSNPIELGMAHAGELPGVKKASW